MAFFQWGIIQQTHTDTQQTQAQGEATKKLVICFSPKAFMNHTKQGLDSSKEHIYLLPPVLPPVVNSTLFFSLICFCLFKMWSYVVM